MIKKNIESYFKTILKNINKISKIKRCRDKDIQKDAEDIEKILKDEVERLFTKKNNLQNELKILQEEIIQLANKTIEHSETLTNKYKEYKEKNKSKKQKKKEQREEKQEEEPKL